MTELGLDGKIIPGETTGTWKDQDKDGSGLEHAHWLDRRMPPGTYRHQVLKTG